jgi:prolyl-tRNA synthetase
MTHGDDQGLVLPPRLAPIQVVIIPIFKSEKEKESVMNGVHQAERLLADLRIKVDDRTEITPGFKFNDWELRGVPVRIEIGPKDIKQNSVTAARRDIAGREGKSSILISDLPHQIPVLLDKIHENLLTQATKFRDEHTFDPKDYDEFKSRIPSGWAFSYWCGDATCEAKIKQDSKATIRCIPLDQEDSSGKCIYCGKDAEHKAYFSRAY